LTITTCHFPPGTRKWNAIEHRLFSYISRNWRGRPLVSLAVIVNLISAMAGPKLGWWWTGLLLGIAELVLGVWAVRSSERS